jgi:hypothetical protein
VVFELDHRVILLEPFKMMHKGIFARSTAITLMSLRVMRQCNMRNAGSNRRDIAVREVPHQVVTLPESTMEADAA